MRPARNLLPLSVSVAWMVAGTLVAAPPVMNRFTIPNPVAELGAGPVSLPVELDFTAPDELRRIELSFSSGSGERFDAIYLIQAQDYFLTGTPKSGIFRPNLQIPAFRNADVWNISVSLTDRKGGVTELPVLPDGSTKILTTTNNGPVDLLPPMITSAVFTPGVVDITGGSQMVQFVLHAEDDTGIEYLVVSLADPDGRHRSSAVLTEMVRITGTARSGTWQGSLSVPALGPAGAYGISYWMQDASRRENSYNPASNPPQEIQTTLTVSTNGPVDSAAPVLTAISASHQEVDVTDAGQTVRLEVSAMDTPGGIRSISALLLDPDGSGRSENIYHDDTAPYTTEPAGGSAEFHIRQYTPPGLYRWRVNTVDGVDFDNAYGQGENPFPGEFSGTLKIVNNGLVRGTPPEASGFARKPAFLPEGALPGLLEYTVRASDHAAVTHVTGFLLKSPVSMESGRNEFTLKLIEGTPQDGIWQGRVKLGRNNLPGNYVTGFRVLNQTGDTATYGLWPGYATPYPSGWGQNFTITPGGPAFTAYQSWSLSHFAENTALGGETDDPDGDGWPNALEFLLEMDPSSPSPMGIDDPPGSLPRLFWNPQAYRLELALSQVNPTLGTGNNLKIKGWKSPTLLPDSWSPLSAIPLSNERRYFSLDPPNPSRRQQFLRLTVGP